MPTLLAEFVVIGQARTAGSKNAFIHPHTKKVVVTDSSGKPGREWRGDVQAAALPHFQKPVEGAVEMELVFYRPRNKGHYGTGRNRGLVRDSAPAFPTVAPDLDKLSRAVLDALTGIAYRDDAQVVTKRAAKRYGTRDEMHVRIFLADEQTAADLPLAERAPQMVLAA